MGLAFERAIATALQRVAPAEVQRRHVARARQGLQQRLAGAGDRPAVTILVDGRPATSETAVKPFGTITYRLTRMRAIAAFALDQAERLSPVHSGRYRQSWLFLIGAGRVALDAIPQGAAAVTLTNDRPYARKIQVGAPGFERYVPPGIVEKVRQLVLHRYGGQVDASVRFIQIPGGYVLKGGRSGRRRRLRKDRAAGRPLLYPALVIRVRGSAGDTTS